MTIPKSSSKLIPILLLLMTIISISPLWHYFLTVNGNIISLLSFIIIFFLKDRIFYINKKYFVWSLIVILGSFFPAMYWLEYRFLLIPIYLITGIYVISKLTIREIMSFINLSTIFLFTLLVGAFIGVIYVYFGGESILQFEGIHGNKYQFYLTTLSTVSVGNLFRPAGILDEPGALSFFMCFVAALRHKVGANKKTTWILLVMGFITGSVAHLIYTTFHLLEEVKTNEKISKWIIRFILILSLILILGIIPGVYDILSTFLFARFYPENINNLGMDRLIPFLNAIELIDIKTFFVGVHPDCTFSRPGCDDLGVRNFGYNPLTLLVGWGVFLSFPYYLALFYLFFMGILKFNYVFLGIFILLLQRPYIMSYGYSMFILLTILIVTGLFFNRRDRKINKKSNIFLNYD